MTESTTSPSTHFSDLPLSEALLRAVQDLGYETPSPIQLQSIPHVVAGKDIVGLAQTGTGKTAAFSLPLLDKVDENQKGVQAIIIAPTRELVIQIAEDVKAFSTYKKNLRAMPIYGGQSFELQLRRIRHGEQVVIATPGRLLDHLRRKTITLDQVQIVVLDEADEMLNMGFREDIEAILDQTPTERQTLLFSATMSREIMALAQRYQKNPETIQVAPQQRTVPKVEQGAFNIHEEDKIELLSRLLDLNNIKRCIIFANTKKTVDEIALKLNARGYLSDSLHGDMDQRRRDQVMRRFRSGDVETLVASDVAARGIDIDDIEVVINFDIPQNAEDYVHRIGRTGRAGRTGKAFSFVSPRQRRYFHEVEHYIRQKISFLPLPTTQEIRDQNYHTLLSKVREQQEQGILDEQSTLVETFKSEGIEIEDALAIMIKLYLEEHLHPEQEKDLVEPRVSRSPHSAPSQRGGRSFGNSRKPSRRSSQPMTTLVLSVGFAQNVEIRDIVGAIANEAGIPGGSIGKVRIGEQESYVDIPDEHVEKVLTRMNGRQIRREPVTIARR